MGLVHEICYTQTSTDTDKYSKHGMQTPEGSYWKNGKVYFDNIVNMGWKMYIGNVFRPIYNNAFLLFPFGYLASCVETDK